MLQVGERLWFRDLEGKELVARRDGKVGWWPDSDIGLEAFQRVRLDPENDGEITRVFQVGKGNDPI